MCPIFRHQERNLHDTHFKRPQTSVISHKKVVYQLPSSVKPYTPLSPFEKRLCEVGEPPLQQIELRPVRGVIEVPHGHDKVIRDTHYGIAHIL